MELIVLVDKLPVLPEVAGLGCERAMIMIAWGYKGDVFRRLLAMKPSKARG